jgi:hypothetical protein
LALVLDVLILEGVANRSHGGLAIQIRSGSQLRHGLIIALIAFFADTSVGGGLPRTESTLAFADGLFFVGLSTATTLNALFLSSQVLGRADGARSAISDSFSTGLETRSTGGALDFFASSSGAVVAGRASVTTLRLNVKRVFLGSACSADESWFTRKAFVYVEVRALGAVTRCECGSELGGRSLVANLSRLTFVRNSGPTRAVVSYRTDKDCCSSSLSGAVLSWRTSDRSTRSQWAEATRRARVVKWISSSSRTEEMLRAEVTILDRVCTS